MRVVTKSNFHVCHENKSIRQSQKHTRQLSLRKSNATKGNRIKSLSIKSLVTNDLRFESLTTLKGWLSSKDLKRLEKWRWITSAGPDGELPDASEPVVLSTTQRDDCQDFNLTVAAILSTIEQMYL